MTTAYGGDHADFSEGTFNDRVIGKVEGDLHEHHHHGPVPTATASLPAPPAGFTGREGDLERLLPVLDPGARSELPVVICAVSGLGGIGKTSLALYAAQLADARSWFPGGMLFVDLRGYDDNPVTADQAVLALLDALGVRGAQLPQTTTAQYALYRTLLAREPRPMLLLLDNASAPEQLTRLLPGVGAGHHRVLVTSRDRLTDLPARLIDLDALSPGDAAELVTLALHLSDDRDDRAAREPDALRDLAETCGHHPLALQMASAMLRRRRHRSIRSLVDDIRDAADPTDVLSLRPVFDVSYARLPGPQARLLRLLAQAPTAEVGTDAAAALADLSDGATLRLLEELAGTHFVTAVPGTGPLRWRLHDLVRAYGVGLGAEDPGSVEETHAARGRLLAFYRRWVSAADDHLRWLLGEPVPELFEGRADALAWLDTERANLVAAAQWAAYDDHAATATAVALNLWSYLDWRRYFDDLITVSRAAQQASERSGDAEQEASAWNCLGLTLWEVERVPEAVDACTRSRDLYRSVGNSNGEAMAWNSLGTALAQGGVLDEAIDALHCARDLHHAAGDRQGEATSWGNLASALRDAGRTEEAITAGTGALRAHQETGSRNGERLAWHTLGTALYDAGRTSEAATAFEKALGICRALEDWYGAGLTLSSLAHTHTAAELPARARDSWLRAAEAFDRGEAPGEAAEARHNAGQ
ncbi:tetratricopeptide repeat protein [Streptomyces sp. NPDC086554]|uniref:ATP-binding protein n=1 Tax=Streptomyces sp. NPDC086554 TaxID=3154864 RepID=UPI0034317D65